MNKMIQLEIEVLRRRIKALYTEYPELLDDEQFKHDVIEGETNAIELLERLTDRILEEKSFQDSIESRVKDLSDRQHRSAVRENGWRTLALQIMAMAKLQKAILTEATLSVASSPAKVVITEQDALPDQYWRTQRVPDKVTISRDLVAKVHVPGAILSNQEESLRVRPK